MNRNKIAFKFNLLHFVIAVLLFFVEVFIAVYVHDDFVRPYIGDVLVVIFLYYLVKIFVDTPAFWTAMAVLLFSYVIETLQYFNFVARIGLGDSKLANIVIGNSFAWADIVAYTAGFVVVLAVELGLRKR